MTQLTHLELKELLSEFNPQFNIVLAPYSTWQIGGMADILITINSSQELEKLLKAALQLDLPTTILGKASNVLISDKGIRGLVIINRGRQCRIISEESVAKNVSTNHAIEARHTHADQSYYDFSDLDYDESNELPKAVIRIDSGVDISYAIAWSLKNNLTGLHPFGGIPGTVGGALFNNIHGGTRHFSDDFVSCKALKKVTNKPQIITLCGPGGVGKNTIVRSLVTSNPDFVRFTTTTTRTKREYEIPGDDYNFVGIQEFQSKINSNQMVEYNELFPGVFYGTDKAKIYELLEQGKTILFDIDYHGAEALKNHFGDKVLTIFIMPPSIEELEKRMLNRGDSQTKIQERMAITHRELKVADTFDYCFVNDDLDEAIQNIAKIIDSDVRFQKHTYDFEAMNFDYDQSILRNSKDIFVLSVDLRLKFGDVDKAKYVANEWAKRKRTQPRISCGSVFKSISLSDKSRLNLPTQAAGYIIDQVLNLKGYAVNNIQISPFHANFIVNNGGGQAGDVMSIINLVQERSKKELGLELEPEIDFLGEF